MRWTKTVLSSVNKGVLKFELTFHSCRENNAWTFTFYYPDKDQLCTNYLWTRNPPHNIINEITADVSQRFVKSKINTGFTSTGWFLSQKPTNSPSKKVFFRLLTICWHRKRSFQARKNAFHEDRPCAQFITCRECSQLFSERCLLRVGKHPSDVRMFTLTSSLNLWVF